MRNWRKVAVAALVAGSLVLGSLPALAEIRNPRIDHREAYQQGRICRGVDAGQVTPREFNRLEREQGRIQAAEARLKGDGRYTRRERAWTRHLQNRSSRHIYRANHNNHAF